VNLRTYILGVLRGIGSAFSIIPARRVRLRSGSPEEQDRQALEEDWRMVGKDLDYYFKDRKNR
jgi:hypothetical protein